MSGSFSRSESSRNGANEPLLDSRPRVSWQNVDVRPGDDRDGPTAVDVEPRGYSRLAPSGHWKFSSGGNESVAGPDGIEVIRMTQLLQEKPEEVFDFIENDALHKLCEFEEQDHRVKAAFGSEPMLVLGHSGADDPEIHSMWRARLRTASKRRRGILARHTGWVGQSLVEAYVLRIKNAAAPGNRGMLQPILTRYRAGFVPSTVFALPAVQAVVHFKWKTWARSWLMTSLILFLLWLASYSAFSVLFMFEKPFNAPEVLPLDKLLATPLGVATVGLSLASMLFMLFFLWMDVCTMWAYGWQWLTFFNIMDVSSYVIQVAVWGMHIARIGLAEDYFSCLLAANHVALWSKLHYFARAFNPTKTLFIDTLREVLIELKWLLFFLTLTMVGFGMAFFCLYRDPHDRAFPEFRNIWHCFTTMFEFMVAMFDHNTFYNSKNPKMATFLFLVYTFVVNIVYVNLLIAIMTNTYARVRDNEGLRFLINKAELIDELETTLPVWLTRNDWYPEFLHVLKVNYDHHRYDPNLESIWTGMGRMEQALYGKSEEMGTRMVSLETNLKDLGEKMDLIINEVRRERTARLVESRLCSSRLSRPIPIPQPRHAAALADLRNGQQSSDGRAKSV